MFEYSLEVCEDEVCCDGGVAIAWDDEVGVIAGGFDKCVVHWAHGLEVLLGNRLGGTPTFTNVAVDAANEAEVCGDIDKYLEVKAFA